MDELNEEIAKLFNLTDSFENCWNAKIEERLTKLDSFLKKATFNAERNNLTGQSVKRPKHTVMAAESHSRYSESEIKQIVSEDLKETAEEQMSDEVSMQAQSLSQRPQRAAKTKIINCLKEIPLSSKLRRPSDPDVKEITIMNVKQEKISNATLLALKAKDASSLDLPEGIKRKSTEKDRVSDEQIKKNDKSLEIVQPKDSVIVLSDDETDKMPPPATFPKKTRPQRTKKENIDSLNLPEVAMTAVKTEKQSISGQQDLSKNEAESKKANVKKEKLSDVPPSNQTARSTRTKRGKAKQIKVKPIVEIKKEVEIENGLNTNNESKSKNTEEKQCIKINGENKSEFISNLKQDGSEEKNNKSFESVYEDAIGEANKDVPQMDKFDKDAVVRVARLKSLSDNNTIMNGKPDSTFMSANDVPMSAKLNEINETFVLEKNRENGAIRAMTVDSITSNLNSSKQTVLQKNVDATFKIEEPAKNTSKETGERHSLLTEDDSEEELEEQRKNFIPPPGPVKILAINTPKKNQIFNPFIPSPMKKKIEAYEKHTENINNISPHRTRAKERTKENEVARKRFVTPTTMKTTTKFLTPTQQSNITPLNGVKKLPGSSKVIPTKTSSRGVLTKSATASRDNSTEDTKRGGINQALLDEKKKNRDLKQQQVAKNREELDKQKIEKAQKVLREKQAKMKAIEESKKVKLQQQQKKPQKPEKSCDGQVEGAFKTIAQVNGNTLEDQIQINKKIEQLHKQYKINQQKAQTPKKAITKPKLYYDFDMLNTDDSTDDESKPSRKRPPIPAWSRLYERKMEIERQNNLPKSIIDNFFSVQPMTPNLREIFPAIDPKCLKRNSSAYWKTPPRYSEMQKF